jgi:ParB-like chromosome segregation protein Spo0J
MELKTRKLFADLIPPLSIEERGELENSIMDEGCRDAICVWNGVIVDGHNRYEICKRRKRAFRVKEMSFENDEAAVAWIIRNQFGRRNLTAMQRAELALKLKDAIAAEAKKRQGARNDLKAKTNIVQKSAPSKTRDELAKMAGVSHDTIAKVEKIIAGAEPEVVEAARKGEMSINAENRTQTRENAPRGARGSAMARAEASPKTVPKLSQNCPMTCRATLKTHFSQCLQGRDAFLTLGQFGDYRGQF